MGSSLGKAIRDIISNGCKPAYFLLGDDLFMQKIFINKLILSLSKTTKPEYFYLNEEIDMKSLFNNISSISLFKNDNVYIIKNFNRLTKDYQESLINHINKPNNENIIIFILNDFNIKNKFAKKISENTVIVDTRTPFSNKKIKEWVKYYYKNEKIFISDEILDYFIENYSDDISTIINEVEKHYLYSDNKNINFNLINNTYNSKHIKIWNLLDAIGEKNIELSSKLYNNLYSNGISLIPILISLNNFYFELLNISHSKSKNTYGVLNKILQSKINNYKSYYTDTEIMNIILNLRDVDIKIKTSSLNEQILFSSIIIRVCNGYYENK